MTAVVVVENKHPILAYASLKNRGRGKGVMSLAQIWSVSVAYRDKLNYLQVQSSQRKARLQRGIDSGEAPQMCAGGSSEKIPAESAGVLFLKISLRTL